MNVIGRTVCLQEPSWNTRTDIPLRVISQLEQKWPNTNLIVSNHYRANTDTRLLSSPLLHTLSYGIFKNSTSVGYRAHLAQLSELKEILLNHPNLRKLDIKFAHNWIPWGVNGSRDQAESLVLNLPINPSDRLPPLHELSFSGPPDLYCFDVEHCRLLSQCMDWSNLRRLDLSNCPLQFVKEIGHRLVNLKSLTMGIGFGGQDRRYWPHGPLPGPLTNEDLEVVTTFIGSLRGLHELRITDLFDAAKTIAPEFSASLKSLQKLSYVSNKPLGVWSKAHLLDLHQNCTNLSNLELDFRLTCGLWVSKYL